jgi:transposase
MECCDLPVSYGSWQTVYDRHRRWAGDGTWEQIMDGLRVGCDQGEVSEWTVGVDATVVRAHQHAAGARQEPPKDIPAQKLIGLLEDLTSDPPDPAGDTGGPVE